MKPTRISAALLAGALVTVIGIGYAAEKADFGKREYDANCAVCHGKQGKGDGPYAGMFDTRVADVTTLSKRNNGVFPLAGVFETIDGTHVVKAYGPRYMPIWGTEYKIKAAEHYMDVPYDDEAFVRTRILALVEYTYRLQAN
jgi:mono/diheme cytochrome c family protein